ncbi:hypothetical protein RB195_016257 [Necator americanus]|uniref:Uncharacterized protein n=1 Tax=Necator americanus TaxID=51031 RepID=A0ABR1E892_NECAM
MLTRDLLLCALPPSSILISYFGDHSSLVICFVAAIKPRPLSANSMAVVMYSVKLLLLSLAALVCGGRFPDPPVFAAPQHYPSICYLPPDSGLCPQNGASAEELSPDLLTSRFTFTFRRTSSWLIRNRSSEDEKHHCWLIVGWLILNTLPGSRQLLKTISTCTTIAFLIDLHFYMFLLRQHLSH